MGQPIYHVVDFATEYRLRSQYCSRSDWERYDIDRRASAYWAGRGKALELPDIIDWQGLSMGEYDA